MVRKFTLLVLCCISLLSGCLKDYPIVKYDRTIATLPEIQSLASMGCQLSYSLDEKYDRLNDNNQLNAIKKAFSTWEEAYPSLRFVDVTNTSVPSNIKIYFALASDSVIYKENTPAESFIKSSYEEASTIVQKNSREVAIYLNVKHDWNVNQITKTIMFHAGYILGLKPSDDPNSVMFPKLTEAPIAVNDTDKKKLKENFPRGCQIWLEKKADLPELYYRKKIFKIGDRVFALAESIYPEFLLYEFNADKIVWEKRKSLIMKEEEYRDPFLGIFYSVEIRSMFAFSISEKGYVGVAYEGIEKGSVWSYDPNKNEWTRIENSKFPGLIDSHDGIYTIGTNTKGYVITYWSGLRVWEFDPLLNNWSSLPISNTLYNSIGHYLDFVGNDKKGYIFYLSTYQNNFFELNTDDNRWKAIASSKIIETSYRAISFAGNDNIYLVIADLNENYEVTSQKMWLFNTDKGPSSEWELLTYFPEKIAKQDLTFGFVTKGRIFIETYDNVIWEYLP